MKSGSIFKPWPSLGIMALLTFSSFGNAQADTKVSDAWGTLGHVGGITCTNPPNNALQLNATRTPAQGTPPYNGNTILATDDVTYWYTGFNCWESTTWTSNGTGRKPARITGVKLNLDPAIPELYLPYPRDIKLRQLTVQDVDLDYDNNSLQFTLPDLTPQPISLTLNNGSLTGVNPPSFVGLAPLTITASGNSQIGPLYERKTIDSQTTLNVTSGATLNLFRLGNQHGSTTADSWYFRSLGNVATIDGGTLKLDQAYVTFGKNAGLPPGPGQYGKMTFQNNALLDIVGEKGQLDSGDFFFVNSAVNLGSGNRFKSVGTMTINGATVTADDYSKLDAMALDVLGTNTLALGKDPGAGDYLVTTGAMVMEPGASLTLNGRGSLAVTFGLDYAFPASGQIVINDNAGLVNAGAHFDIRPSSPITINRTSADVYGFLEVKNGGTLDLRAAASDTGHVTNHGGIGVSTDGGIVALGPVLIQGGSEGSIDIDSGGVLSIGNQGTQQAAIDSLTTNNTVTLNNFSALQLTLDPTAGKNGQLRLGSTLYIERLADLHLTLVNDQVLPGGTKFTLIDYGVLPAGDLFNGHLDGSTFVLGLNHYRINYRDTGDPGYNGAITLTVVPATPPVSLSPAVQTITGTVGTPLTQTAAMIPTGFGGTVTYTISPGLPNGLTFNNATGAIFGTPSAALTTTDFTIRAAGSTSGTATATVNLTIGVANQTINFGPAPTPTFSPSGGFQVFASATSGLPITYSSLTPSICDAHGSTIVMLGAGTCTIAADQAGNTNYIAAPQATQSITITKAQPQPLTLSASSVSITVGGNSTLSATGGIPGGSVTYTVNGACSAVSSLVTGGPGTGTCTATATQAADANYLAVTSNPVAISVGVAQQAALSLTASPATITVNDVSTLSTQGGTGSGAVSYALNTGPCTLVGNVLTATGVGQCQVTATKAESTGYSAVTSNPVIVTINRLAPPTLVLSASPVSVGFNGSSTLSTTGGIPGAPVNYSVSGPCSVSGNTLLGVSAGLCIVTASQAETPVYSAASSSPVTVTVKERTTTFSYPHATAIIGQPFSLAPVTSGFTNPTFALLYGNLPAGLILNPTTGVISGTPTGPTGTIDGVISAYENNAYDAALDVVTVQNPAPPPPNPIPTLGEWGAMIMALMMLFVVGGRRMVGR
jgi:ribosomal protein S11